MKKRLNEFSREELQEIVQNSSSMSELCLKLNFSKSGDMFKRIRAYLDELDISTDHFLRQVPPTKRTAENVFMENSTADQKTLRKWYFEGHYTPYKCSICGQLPLWNNKPLTLILDHINGHNKDNRLTNLRWVCPNCNQQLPTTSGKNLTYNK